MPRRKRTGHGNILLCSITGVGGRGRVGGREGRGMERGVVVNVGGRSGDGRFACL